MARMPWTRHEPLKLMNPPEEEDRREIVGKLLKQGAGRVIKYVRKKYSKKRGTQKVRGQVEKHAKHFHVFAIKPKVKVYFVPFNQLAECLFISITAAFKLQLIIWISATDMFSVSAHRSCSQNELFLLDTFQLMSHPASTAVCPLWLQQICK